MGIECSGSASPSAVSVTQTRFTFAQEKWANTCYRMMEEKRSGGGLHVRLSLPTCVLDLELLLRRARAPATSGVVREWPSTPHEARPSTRELGGGEPYSLLRG